MHVPSVIMKFTELLNFASVKLKSGHDREAIVKLHFFSTSEPEHIYKDHSPWFNFQSSHSSARVLANECIYSQTSVTLRTYLYTK